MFRDRLRGPIDAMLPSRGHVSYSDRTSYIEGVTSKNVELQEKVTQNIKNAQKKDKACL